MALYMEYSTRIYNIYLKYIAPEDIHSYSIDEVFIDVTDYLNTYHMNARELAMTMIQDVLKTTGIAATADMYLCKIAMDIVAKHIEPDKNGVRIAELDEMSYRRQLWNHRPITDFWRVGRGYAKKLVEHVKAYKPETNSVSSGQVLQCPYDYETARLTDERLELDAEIIAQLNDKLNVIRENLRTEPKVSITYFVPDAKKSGGAYVEHSGIVKKSMSMNVR